MSNSDLPAEILDHIIDHLHDATDSLKNCSLVSKSWIPRTRKHLFADIKFDTVKCLQSWKEAFPDPSTSPACYAKTLFIDCVVAGADADVGDWVRGFSRVACLELSSSDCHLAGVPPSLATIHGFSPAITSLRINFIILPPSWFFNLVLSFPLLENLAVVIFYDGVADSGDGPLTTTEPSSTRMFTGSLELYLMVGMGLFTRRLLSSPGGIHFRELTWTWFHEEDLSSLMALVEGCSHALESLDITRDFLGTSIQWLPLHR